jgi:hypothetical protein
MKTEAPLFLIGCIVILVGVFFVISSKIPFLSHLPGNIMIKRKNFSFYFPLGLSLIISIILTLALNLILGKK